MDIYSADVLKVLFSEKQEKDRVPGVSKEKLCCVYLEAFCICLEVECVPGFSCASSSALSHGLCTGAGSFSTCVLIHSNVHM